MSRDWRDTRRRELMVMFVLGVSTGLAVAVLLRQIVEAFR